MEDTNLANSAFDIIMTPDITERAKMQAEAQSPAPNLQSAIRSRRQGMMVPASAPVPKEVTDADMDALMNRALAEPAPKPVVPQAPMPVYKSVAPGGGPAEIDADQALNQEVHNALMKQVRKKK